ncbi:hypothetical protein ACPTF0_12080 [Enterococcus faecalis]
MKGENRGKEDKPQKNVPLLSISSVIFTPVILLIFFILAGMYKVIMWPSDVLFRVSSDLSLVDFARWIVKKQ